LRLYGESPLDVLQEDVQVEPKGADLLALQGASIYEKHDENDRDEDPVSDFAIDDDVQRSHHSCREWIDYLIYAERFFCANGMGRLEKEAGVGGRQGG